MTIKKKSKNIKKSKTDIKKSKTHTKKLSKIKGLVNINHNSKNYIKKTNDIYIKLKKEVIEEWNKRKRKKNV